MCLKVRVTSIMGSNRKASIGGTRTDMSTGQDWDIPGAGVVYFNKNAVAFIISWS